MARGKWVSNGDNYSPNEVKLLGRMVVLRQGNREWRGMLHYVRARTRGNTTLAVGREPVWRFRKCPFTIELDEAIPAAAALGGGE